MTHLTYFERSNYCLSIVGKRLLQLMEEKQTNLSVSADVTSVNQLLSLADQLGPEICALKTHMDIIEDFNPDMIPRLRKLSHKHNFLLFEDRKFADIGNIVKQQYQNGIYRIASWADIVTAHTLPGPGIVEGLAEIGRKKNRGILLVAEMSSAGHLLNMDYINNTLQIAEQYADFVIGFITQRQVSEDPHWINIAPGVKLTTDADKLGQQYVTPEKAILENGADIIIVGRGIIAAKDALKEAKKYRERAWQSYLKRSSSSRHNFL